MPRNYRPREFGDGCGVSGATHMLTLLVSFISGGLAGGIVSAISNRIFHWRALRAQFYPKLNNMHSAYVIRFNEIKGGRQLVNITGQVPSDEDT
jgi:hypothetical protein